MSGFGIRLRALLFPPRCAACDELLDWFEVGHGSDALCPECLKKWNEAALERCEVCGEAVSVCRCLTEELGRAKVRELRKLVYYRARKNDTVQNQVIFRIKEGRDARTDTWLAMQLQKHLAAIVAEAGEDNVILTYAPRSRRAVLKTGTDQARSLAQALSRQSGVPLVTVLCRAAGRAQEQKRLSAEERVLAAKSAYLLQGEATDALKGMTVVLIDDIVTTGATSGACARLLRQGGALRVYCLAVASDDTNRDAAVPADSRK
jgi:ComF family protein